jgi:hypothetical protein
MGHGEKTVGGVHVKGVWTFFQIDGVSYFLGRTDDGRHAAWDSAEPNRVALFATAKEADDHQRATARARR